MNDPCYGNKDTYNIVYYFSSVKSHSASCRKFLVQGQSLIDVDFILIFDYWVTKFIITPYPLPMFFGRLAAFTVSPSEPNYRKYTQNQPL